MNGKRYEAVTLHLKGRGHTDSVRNRQEVRQFARCDNSPSKKSPGHRRWLPCSIRPASCIEPQEETRINRAFQKSVLAVSRSTHSFLGNRAPTI